MAFLYVASDRKGAGKTAFCTSLAQELSEQGKRVALLRLWPRDSQADDLAVDLGHQLHIHSSISVLSERLEQGTGLDKVIKAAREACQDRDTLIVEGLSGLDNQESGKLAHALEAHVVLIVGYTPTLRPEDLLPAKELFGQRLLGLVINGATRYRGTQIRESLLPSMEAHGLHIWGVIPEDRRLLSVTVRQLAEFLEGRTVVEADGRENELIEHFMIGGWILDWGVLYFGQYENKAVIVRGDRPDIQMAALETSTTCLVLTEGVEPIQYVLYEAREEGVPVIVVKPDTLATASALDGLMERARFDHLLKLKRFQEHLQQRVDIRGLYSAAER